MRNIQQHKNLLEYNVKWKKWGRKFYVGFGFASRKTCLVYSNKDKRKYNKIVEVVLVIFTFHASYNVTSITKKWMTYLFGKTLGNKQAKENVLFSTKILELSWKSWRNESHSCVKTLEPQQLALRWNCSEIDPEERRLEATHVCVAGEMHTCPRNYVQEMKTLQCVLLSHNAQFLIFLFSIHWLCFSEMVYHRIRF
jgi:hypothetical protein